MRKLKLRIKVPSDTKYLLIIPSQMKPIKTKDTTILIQLPEKRKK